MTRDRIPTEIESFASLAECVEVAKSRPHWKRKDLDKWFMGASWEEIDAYVTTGWPEGASEASDKSNRIADRILNSQTAMSLSTELNYDMAGACYDVGGFLSGTPECWIRPEPTLTCRAISIVLNVAASAGVDASTIKRRGMAVATLVLALQAKGYPVTVDVAQVCAYGRYSEKSGTVYCKVVRVIDASTGSQLDVDRLVFAIGHSAMFRGVFSAVTGANWDSSLPESDGYPPGDYDLKFGAAHLDDAARWTDGGESWILKEFERQTSL